MYLCDSPSCIDSIHFGVRIPVSAERSRPRRITSRPFGGIEEERSASHAYLFMHASGQDFRVLQGMIREYARRWLQDAISSTSLHDACLICTAALREALAMIQPEERVTPGWYVEARAEAAVAYASHVSCICSYPRPSSSLSNACLALFKLPIMPLIKHDHRWAGHCNSLARGVACYALGYDGILIVMLPSPCLDQSSGIVVIIY